MLERAAAVLAASPGGPAEARRRLTEGLPLIVGLSRADTEKVQGRLVDLGLIPRIGPAPPGTTPLSKSSSAGILWPAIFIASLAGAGSVFWFVAGPGSARPGASPTPSAGPQALAGAPASPSTPTPEPAFPLILRVEVQRVADGGLVLVGAAQVRTTDTPPSGDLSLVVRAGSTGAIVLNEYVPEAQARTHTRVTDDTAIVTKSLAFRLPLDEGRFADGREAVVEASWGLWTSPPISLTLPPAR